MSSVVASGTRVALCAGILALAGVASAQSTALTCFAVRDPAPRGSLQVVLPPDLGGQQCVVRTPARMGCLETRGAQISPGLPSGGSGGEVTTSVLCYKARCAPPRPAAGQVTDALGARSVRFRAARMLCLPADTAPGATTTTVPGTPATTTTTIAPEGCSFTDGECRGTCAGGQRCGAAVGTGDCECRAVACGDADAPECAGACSDPDEACIFDLTGCQCVSIP